MPAFDIAILLVLSAIFLYLIVLAERRPEPARIVFGSIYLGAAILNLAVALSAPGYYAMFADAATIPLYRDLWHSVVAPNLAVFLPLLIVFQFAVAVAIFNKGIWVKVGLAGGLLFTLLLAPANPYALPILLLAVAQAVLLRHDFPTSALHGDRVTA